MTVSFYKPCLFGSRRAYRIVANLSPPLTNVYVVISLCCIRRPKRRRVGGTLISSADADAQKSELEGKVEELQWRLQLMTVSAMQKWLLRCPAL